jgi:hypothetical protein
MRILRVASFDGRSPGSEPFNPAFPASPVAFGIAPFTTVAGAAPALNRLPVSPSDEGTVTDHIALHRGKDNHESGV